MEISVLFAAYSLKSTGLTSALGTNDAGMSDFSHPVSNKQRWCVPQTSMSM